MTTTTPDTTGRRSRTTSLGRILTVVEREGGGYDCTIYRDGICIDSCAAPNMRGLLTVMSRERWTRIDLLATTTQAEGGDWPVTTVSLRQAK